MKKCMVIFSIILCTILSSCTLPGLTSPTSPTNHLEEDIFNRFYDNDGEQADLLFEQIIQSLENHDAQALKDLFSLSTCTAVENIEDDISKLLKYYNGEMVSFKRYGPGSEATKEGTSKRKEIFASYDVTTTEAEYRIAFRFCTVDSDNSDNIGLYSFYIIEAENSDRNFAYWGNDEWIVGINIEPAIQEIPVNIFVPDENAENFNTIPTVIYEQDADQIITLLIEQSMLEDGIALNTIELNGTQLNLDFNQRFLDQLNSCGTSGERMLIGTVVNTFLSVYEAETVYITVDGEIMESGHVIYDFPIGFIE